MRWSGGRSWHQVSSHSSQLKAALPRSSVLRQLAQTAQMGWMMQYRAAWDIVELGIDGIEKGVFLISLIEDLQGGMQGQLGPLLGFWL